ncbi:MAG TPA: hypothetical protein PKK00_13215 [Bacteroidales bacterium]|nr:hypothetical protein [Bacteroidales bacterium]HPS18265.1 hypothetical protein [Bacteroidales bacterium]
MKFITSLLLCLAAINFCFCQTDTVYKETKEYTCTFKYSETSTNSNKNTNYIIEEISKSIPKILEYTQVSFTYIDKLSITNIPKSNKKEIKNYKISFQIVPEKPTGDILYKTFDISDVLLPGKIEIEYSANEKGILKPFKNSTECIKNSTNKTFIISQVYIDSIPFEIPQIKIEKINFTYNDSDLYHFKIKTQLIKDYYNSEFSISAAKEKLSEINLTYIDLVKVYDIKLKEIEKTMTEIYNKDFIAKLGLYSHDPIDFINKFSTLNVKVKTLRSKINEMLSTLDVVNYNKAIECLSKNDTTNALNYLKKSAIANPYYSPAFLLMARILYLKNELTESGKNLINITTRLNPNQEILKQVIKLADSLDKRFIARGESSILAEDYHAALNILNDAKNFCSNIKVINCPESLQKSIAKAKYGIYKSFLIVSKKAVDTDNLDIAEIYITNAKDFQDTNSSDIISSSEADNLLSQLITGLTTHSISLNSKSLYDSAYVILQDISNLCYKYKNNACDNKYKAVMTVTKQGIYKSFIKKAKDYIKYNDPVKAEETIVLAKKYQQENPADIPSAIAADSLTGQLKEKYYMKYISDGISYLKLQNGISALHSFGMAKDIERNYIVKPDTLLDSLLHASAKPYISNFIQKGNMHTWGNEPGKAKEMADTVKVMMKMYNLENDSIINLSFADLETKISALYCKQANEKYNESCTTAKQKISLNNYAEAYDYYQKAIAVTQSNSRCKISDTDAKSGITKYQEAAKYQKLRNQSDSAVRLKLYNFAIDKYYEAEKLAASLNMEQYGLSHIPFEKYIISQNESYILNAAKYFSGKNNSEKTFSLLNILANRNFSDSTVFLCQEQLARMLSKTDYYSNPNQKPAELIKKYTSNNKWFLTFRKTYILCWKEYKKKK